MESRARATGEQFATLLEFMKSHGDLAKPQRGALGRLKADRLWQQLVNTLNAIGGGVNKTQDKWKRVWADWKSKTKKKASTIRCHASGTGGGPNTRLNLTALEERVLGIIGVLAVEGHSDIEEQGFDRTIGERPRFTAPSQLYDVVNEDGIAPIRSPSPSPLPSFPSTSRQQLPTPARRLPPRAATPPTPAIPLPSILEPLQASPHSSAASSHRRRRLFARRRRALTPFDRASSEFVAVEQRRLQLEEKREANEARRIEVEHDRNNIFRRLADVAEAFLQQYLLRAPQ